MVSPGKSEDISNGSEKGRFLIRDGMTGEKHGKSNY